MLLCRVHPSRHVVTVYRFIQQESLRIYLINKKKNYGLNYGLFVLSLSNEGNVFRALCTSALNLF